MEYQKLIADLEQTYYAQVVLLIVELATLITGILYTRKLKTQNLFILYIALDLCFLIINWLFLLLNVPHKFLLIYTDTTNVIIGYVELLVYYKYFKKVLFGKKIHYYINYSLIIYSLVLLYTFAFLLRTDNNNVRYTTFLINTFEFILLLPPCLYYYYQILTFPSNTNLNLSERPSFWIITGIFFFCIISIPYYLLTTYMSKTNNEFKNIAILALYYLPFSINFLFLIKAFRCKKILTI